MPNDKHTLMTERAERAEEALREAERDRDEAQAMVAGLHTQTIGNLCACVVCESYRARATTKEK